MGTMPDRSRERQLHVRYLGPDLWDLAHRVSRMGRGGLAVWPRPLERPPLDFAAEVARVAPATEVRILAPGEIAEVR